MNREQGAAPGGRGAAGRSRPPSGDELPPELLADEGLEDLMEEAVSPRGADDPSAGGSQILPDAAALTSERDEYLLALQRLQADFENYRKRVVRQQEEQAARAAQDLVGKVLPVLDTLDLARAHLGGESGEVSGEGRALEQARSQLLDVLSKEGLERVDAAGVAFDPVVHDAVAHASADAETTEDEATDDETAATPSGVTVDEVLRAGYRWRGQVLRPAMVRVRG